MQKSSPSIHIRSATLQDKERLQNLYRRTIDATCRNDYDTDQREAWKRGTENCVRWEQALLDQYFLVAEIDGEIAGFASLAGADYIDFMYTHRDHLRKGVAYLLFANLEARARDRGAQMLTADVSKTARPFFEKQGFTAVQENWQLIRGVWINNFKMQKPLSLH